MSNITYSANFGIDDICERPERFEVALRQEVESQAMVEYFPADDEFPLPQVVFTWRPEAFFYKPDDLAALAAVGIGNGEDGVRVAMLNRDGSPKMMSATLTNFRRYAWSWARGHRARTGYGCGHVYANGVTIHGGLMPSPAFTVRDSLVRAWTTYVGARMPGYFNNSEVHELLELALIDALAHLNDHAAPRRVGGQFLGAVVNHDAGASEAIAAAMSFASEAGLLN